MDVKEQEEEENVVVPITSLDVKMQEYVFLTHQIETISAQVKILRDRRKLLQSDVCNSLQEQPNRRRLFTIPTNKVETFGKSCCGLFLYKRKRTKEFNRQTFKTTMIEQCMPLLQGKVAEDQIWSFAALLAENVWNARPSRSFFEIMPQRESISRKKKKEQAQYEDDDESSNRKRKPNTANLTSVKTNNLSDDASDDGDLF